MTLKRLVFHKGAVVSDVLLESLMENMPMVLEVLVKGDYKEYSLSSDLPSGKDYYYLNELPDYLVLSDRKVAFCELLRAYLLCHGSRELKIDIPGCLANEIYDAIDEILDKYQGDKEAYKDVLKKALSERPNLKIIK